MLGEDFWLECGAVRSQKAVSAEAPVWLPHAVIARGHCPSPDPSAPDSLRMIWDSHVRIFLSLLTNPHIVLPPVILRDHKKSRDVCKGGGQVSDKHTQIRDRKRKIRKAIECDIANSELAES